MRIGIMGGTMDPIHSGHIAIAQMVRNALQLDEMLLLPAGDPPHKTPHVDKWHRLKMVQLAAEEAGMQVSDTEVRRIKTTFTVDTLTEFTSARPDVEWFYVVGGDTLFVIEKWRNFPKVAAMCTFAVVARPGDDRLSKQMADVTARTGAKFVLVDGIGPDISSTKVREMAAAGENIADMVSKCVAKYIADHRLYQQLTIDEMYEKLAGMIPEKRLKHSIGVMETAVRLAHAAGADPEKARIAGMLHDCAKKLDKTQLLTACEKGGVILAPGEAENDDVLHAPAGVYIARYEFGVTDKEILSAIRWHTVGAPGMTPLEELIFVADFIEPNRRPIPGLEEIRKMAEKDLHAAARMCAESTKRYVTGNGWSFCEQTQAMLDSYNDELLSGGIPNMMEPKTMALEIAKILDKKGARDISVLEIGHLSSIADYMVVCTGRNAPAVQALSRDLDDKMFEQGIDVRRREGVNEARWIVMDYECVLVHIFHPEEREYYNIDRLWMDGSNQVKFESEFGDE